MVPGGYDRGMLTFISPVPRLQVAESLLPRCEIEYFARNQLDYFCQSELKFPNWRGAGKRVGVSKICVSWDFGSSAPDRPWPSLWGFSLSQFVIRTALG